MKTEKVVICTGLFLACLTVGHSPNNRSAPSAQEEGGPDEPQLNPITGEMEYNGTSIIDITDPSKPTTKWHRGLAYATDRVGTGLFVVEYTGPKPVVDNGTPIPAPARPNQTN
jgi:hypothetical protein